MRERAVMSSFTVMPYKMIEAPRLRFYNGVLQEDIRVEGVENGKKYCGYEWVDVENVTEPSGGVHWS